MNTKQFSDWLQQVNDIEIIKVNETSVMFFAIQIMSFRR